MTPPQQQPDAAAQDGTTANGPDTDADLPDYLDAGLMKIAGVCLRAVMTILDTPVVSVAQHPLIHDFGSPQACIRTWGDELSGRLSSNARESPR
ncbi:MAG: hypothetical protein JO044_01530 [Mycobacteriaceae bacterium]|nr:hypothetical protein [Mycobacteriaceae bacterium]MBV9640991.1 hypothetical protein [Mycobacteriaceae bacterium]